MLAVCAASRGALPPGLGFALLLLWSPAELAILMAGSFLTFARLSLAQAAQIGSEQRQGNGLVAVWTTEHIYIILHRVGYVKPFLKLMRKRRDERRGQTVTTACLT